MKTPWRHCFFTGIMKYFPLPETLKTPVKRVIATPEGFQSVEEEVIFRMSGDYMVIICPLRELKFYGIDKIFQLADLTSDVVPWVGVGLSYSLTDFDRVSKDVFNGFIIPHGVPFDLFLANSVAELVRLGAGSFALGSSFTNSDRVFKVHFNKFYPSSVEYGKHKEMPSVGMWSTAYGIQSDFDPVVPEYSAMQKGSVYVGTLGNPYLAYDRSKFDWAVPEYVATDKDLMHVITKEHFAKEYGKHKDIPSVGMWDNPYGVLSDFDRVVLEYIAFDEDMDHMYKDSAYVTIDEDHVPEDQCGNYKMLRQLLIKIGAGAAGAAIIVQLAMPLPTAVAWTVGPAAGLIVAAALAFN